MQPSKKMPQPAAIQQLQSLVRVGLPIKEMVAIDEGQRGSILQSRVSDALSESLKLKRLSEREKLQLLCLAAEFKFNFGSPEEAARESSIEFGRLFRFAARGT